MAEGNGQGQSREKVSISQTLQTGLQTPLRWNGRPPPQSHVHGQPATRHCFHHPSSSATPATAFRHCLPPQQPSWSRHPPPRPRPLRRHGFPHNSSASAPPPRLPPRLCGGTATLIMAQRRFNPTSLLAGQHTLVRPLECSTPPPILGPHHLNRPPARTSAPRRALNTASPPTSHAQTHRPRPGPGCCCSLCDTAEDCKRRARDGTASGPLPHESPFPVPPPPHDRSPVIHSLCSSVTLH